MFLKNKQLKRISEKWNSQLTKDRRYDKVSKSSTKRQQNLNSKMFEKTWKKYLTNKKRWDKINELSERQNEKTLITKQWNTYDSRKFLYIFKNGSNEPKAVKTRDSQTVVLSDRIKHFLSLWLNQCEPQSSWCEHHWIADTFYQRVWSWLRMNAGGVLNTCKSNGNYFIETSVDLI